MSLRQMFAGSIVKPGLNPLGAQTTTYTYNYNLFSWGTQPQGQLGLGNITSYSSPKQVGALTNWLQLAAGDYVISALKTDGTLWCWGRGVTGAIGQGNTTSYSSPVQVGALTTWANTKGGTLFVAAIKTDGTLWSWGNNNQGQLGLNTSGAYANKSSPTQVGSLTNWSKLSVGYGGSTLAIKTDGTLWSWGFNVNGELGLNNTTAYSSPVQVGALTNWLKVAVNYGTSVAIKTDGTLWAWGQNNGGQLGQGNIINTSSPKQIGALTNWSSAVTCQQYSVAAIKTDGTLWAWGYNSAGALGTGNLTKYSSPKQVGALTNWFSIAGGYSAFVAVKTDGTIWAWGQNNKGALGLGNTTNYSSPKQIGSVVTWKQTNPSMSYSAAFALG